MKYDFDTPVERYGSDSIKWKVKEGELPMWVADMDFKTAPGIIEALSSRVEHGVFGYPYIPEDWSLAYASWWKRRHGLEMDPKHLLFVTGVIPAISSSIRKLTTPNENIVIQTPVYNVFFNCINNNGARVLENRLIYSDGAYSIDWEDLEKSLSDPQTTMMILCNPQNPAGKIWDRETLSRIGLLCHKYGVTVISDEIHCDIARPGTSYVPFASVSDICADISITCLSPTKAFNIAGIGTAAVYIPNNRLRHKVFRAINTDEVAEPSVFACLCSTTAFDKCEDWIEEMNSYVFENRSFAERFISENIPSLHVVSGDATYLLWVDISSLGCTSSEFASFARKNTGLFVTEGSHYGSCGEGFLRINIACPRSVLEDGLDRLKRSVELFRS